MDAAFFISFIIVAITQIIKMYVPKVNGGVTIIVALLVGALVGLIDQYIGVTDISVAGGLVAAGAAVGITAAASKAGGGAKGDESSAQG